MNKLFYFLAHPRYIVVAILERFGGWIPDKQYLRLAYYLHTGERLHLNPPKTFNEKIQWLKLYDRNPLYTSLVDKYEVKEYVAKIIGEEFIIPTLGVWDSPEDIDYDRLPQKFVLKTTHDGGGEGVIICDKDNLDVKRIKSKLERSFKRNIYRSLREWPYKGIKPRVMAEQLIEPSDMEGEGLKDYKFFCFNGDPKFCQVKSHRDSNNYIDLFDMQWDLLPFTGLNPNQLNAEITPKRPDNYVLMVKLAKSLCYIADFVRIDFYNVNGRIYFGEITFYPASGMGTFTPKEYDYLIGEKLDLKKC